MLIHSVDHPDLPPFEMPARFKMEIVYFMTPSGNPGVPPLGPNEYWIRLDEAIKWLERAMEAGRRAVEADDGSRIAEPTHETIALHRRIARQ